MSDSCCGASNCCANNGGYQVHITFSNPNGLDIKQLVSELQFSDTELVFLKNYTKYPTEYYEEMITSTNFKSLTHALVFMFELNLTLNNKNFKVLRTKIESNPRTSISYLYIETHYKITKETAQKINGKILISENSKGTLFATVRHNSREQSFTEPNFEYISKMNELVVFDSNTNLDKQWEASIS